MPCHVFVTQRMFALVTFNGIGCTSLELTIAGNAFFFYHDVLDMLRPELMYIKYK